MNEQTSTFGLGGRRSIALLAAIAGLALIAGPLASPVAGHTGHKVTVEGSEDCEKRTYCFKVTSGSLDDLAEGEQATIVFKNPSSNSLDHNLHVTTKSKADTDGRDTDGSAAFANTTTIAPGEKEQLTFTVPSGADGLYFWCDVGVHEDQGMYRMVQLGSSDPSGTAGNDDAQNSSPGPGLGIAVIGLAGAALALRRD